ncbi:tripartite tricarboxylate transporter TctB family protein [Xanthobacteraceae bacterium Astr-EGSB]|uniref:tripartite tricarboxylate transporter TctB family protein n=1 Tax=Astrobacterium formosum TaxID=3069710 RepID=UPI0027B457E8|nr:tripartite tricarboxylate transporter TctB family protein [Xanthobacteraceae bacterium Astr-EGSB]
MTGSIRTGIPHWIGDALVGLALAGGGAVLVALSLPIPRGEIGNPGPGFLPLVLGLVLVGLGIGCAVRAWRAHVGAGVVLAERKAVVCVVALFGAALAFVPFGFVPTMAIFLAVLFGVLASMPWWRAALAGGVASIAVWFWFERLLGLSLPAGVVGF